MNELSTEQRIARQREMLAILAERFRITIENGGALEKKAWGVLSTGSTIFAAVAVLQAALAKDAKVGTAFWAGLVVVLVLYLGMALSAFAAIWPAGYHYPAAEIEDGGSFSEWEAEFITTDESDYLETQIINLTGNGEAKGAIGLDEDLNRQRAVWVRVSASFLVTMIMGLVVLAMITALA